MGDLSPCVEALHLYWLTQVLTVRRGKKTQTCTFTWLQHNSAASLWPCKCQREAAALFSTMGTTSVAVGQVKRSPCQGLRSFQPPLGNLCLNITLQKMYNSTSYLHGDSARALLCKHVLSSLQPKSHSQRKYRRIADTCEQKHPSVFSHLSTTRFLSAFSDP